MVEDAERLRERLRLANAEHERLTSMADAWWRISSAASEHAEARVLLYRLGPERFTDRVLVAWTRAPEGVPRSALARARRRCPARWGAPSLSAQAAHFIERGVPRGPQLGAAPGGGREAWIAARTFQLDQARPRCHCGCRRQPAIWRRLSHP